MFIKQITISNFRSFRQQPEVHPFSPGMNAVVGRNGSGKSNMFDAVQFALLSPKFWSLRTEERQALLHEGSGSAAVNAFVEIVFDNSDNRFSIENSDEVVLRRTIGHKKDEYFLQRKRANKNEIMSLLEGAGFSKSNPYFIVQQGKVNALCTMSDSERLVLLKEVAGTTVYDEKKSESLAKMEENKSSIEKIDEILSYIEQRLNELRGEKEELTEYQRLDRNRRAMEYTLYDKELRRARETLDEIEHSRSDEAESLRNLHEDARATNDDIRNMEATLKAKSGALRRSKKQLSSLESDRTALVTKRTKLELECRELEDAVRFGEETLVANQHEIERLAQEIQSAQMELEKKVQPKYDEAKSALATLTNQRDEAQKRIEGLYAKQGRGRQFRTKEERDEHLQGQIADLQSVCDEKESLQGGKRDRLAALRRQITAHNKDLTKRSGEVAKNRSSLDAFVKTMEAKEKERDAMAEDRKERWKEMEEINEKVSEARERARTAVSDMRKTMPRATHMGLDALSRIVEQEGVRVGEQYFGLLMQNMELIDPKFGTAVEVAAQNALFHVIVDNDSTAARLMRRLEKDKLGRVTFLPLDQLNIDQAQYPDSPDVAPMITRCIRYDRRVHRAMQHVFGKKLLARSVDAASTWSAQCDMDAITLEGDLCSRRGALSGGYIDTSKSRIKAHSEHIGAEQSLHKLLSDQSEMRRKIDAADQSVSTLMRELQRLDVKKVTLERTLGRAETEIVSLRTNIEKKTKQCSGIEDDQLPPVETEIKSLERQIEALEEELGTELSDKLSDKERDTLVNLKTTQVELEADIERHSQALEEISIERERLHSLLNDNLLKRRQELEGGESPGSSQSSPEEAQAKRVGDFKQYQQLLEEASQNEKELEAQVEESKKALEDARGESTTAKAELEKLKAKDQENQRALEEVQEAAERLLNKRSICVSKRELYMRKIQELGSLPPTSELQRYTSMSISSLMKNLESINKELKKYSHVNKKAYDQYVNFSEQRESLLKRKEELDQGAEKVKELIESLDRQKDEAINRTFRGVSAHFQDVFKELVPNGAGELIMRTALDEEASTQEGDEDESGQDFDPKNPNVSLYRGIGIKVRFSPVGENYMMSQLSGGQKALVALSLIFSIQRCDPAPFYLFDELDQALDSTYRAAVAAMIKKQATSDENPTQFICSTFRPELVAVANRCYGISHQNKVSSIHLLSKKDALHFIADLMSEEEAVGAVSTLPASKTSSSSKRTASRKRKQVQQTEEEGDDRGVA